MSKAISSPIVGQRIRVVRKSAGLTLEALGQRIGISNQALSSIETGKTNASKQTLISLARELKSDFGEVWLTDYLAGADPQTYVEVIGPPDSGKYKFGILQKMFDGYFKTNYGDKIGRLTKENKRHGVPVPIVCEVSPWGAFRSTPRKKIISIPSRMVPPNRSVVAVSIINEPIRDAFVGPRDIVTLTMRPKVIKGQLIFIYANSKVMIKRWTLNNDKITLLSPDKIYDPIVIPVNNVECLGEVTGILRFS
jgi:transcriptional regulator with XRE-family HTH domain